ncbi:holo-[acyl-carrier protein] synthase [Actinobaculum suis]|uniref:Holo-[acyl-carrier-protein] synthase n=1 Tax=Actinobaculum suis TaxID=1657 RepID=A0A1G7AR67_9ACTO|nr:holo-ACP synthase [Actinobaculum suis]MDY5153379.1 holo-ACP synthase [Actinobaculum suis]SDE16406.1 holo-[acyl-carrier protein] synthase [Actinobaculum suis]
MILGIGVDTVAVSEFAEQLARPGSHFGAVFTAREHRYVERRAARRGKAEQAAALAARWAAKEAFVKAWSAALHGTAPVAPENIWADIEVSNDRWGRPALQLLGETAQAVHESLGEIRIHVSLSHDGDMAVAFVVVENGA